MDQAVVAGIGNVQAMEALWRAGLHPERAAGSLRLSALGFELRRRVERVVRLAGGH
jgi:formamidopyrimidine-DNA glycosylase